MILKSSLHRHHDLVLKEGTQILGRSPENPLVVAFPHVSRTHARITVSGEMVLVEDLESKNRTFVNGRALLPHSPRAVHLGDTLSFGAAESSFILVRETPQEREREPLFSASGEKGPEIRLGRARTNEIVVESSVVSSLHLVFRKGEDGFWYGEDQGSSNGTFLQTRDNKVTRFRLEPQQVLYLGTYKLPSERILQFLEAAQKKKPERIRADADVQILGRDPEADIVISHPSVSWHHARLSRQAQGYLLEDLGSSNGTYVNGNQISAPTLLRDGDEILLGFYAFVLEAATAGKSVLMKKETLDGFILEAREVGRTTANGFCVLDAISLAVNPGELVGLMGLSGAGKTSLLKVLNGYDRPTEGRVFINGMDLHEHYPMFRTIIGYVPQDDIVHPELTVQEALEYYAGLRLPADIRPEEIRDRIQSVLHKLGLSDVAHVVIGSPDTEKGISGGQRKRVNLAMELLADPAILFLDEPTSGLSAVDALKVMELLRHLADQGKTILLTIHQPSLETYRLMDNQIVLSYGKLAYYGPGYPDSIRFFNPGTEHPDLPASPDRALMGLHAGEAREEGRERSEKGRYWQQRYRESKLYQTYVAKRRRKAQELKSDEIRLSGLRQFGILCRRAMKVKQKDRAGTLLLLIQAPVIAFLVAMLFSREAYWGTECFPGMAPTLFFVLAIAAVWCGNINASREIVAERAIYERERRVGLHIWAYVASKFSVLSLLCLVQSFSLLLVVWLFTPFCLELGSGILLFFILLLMSSLAGLSLGLLISALSKTQAQALAIIPLVLLPMILFGGGIISVKQMRENPNPLSLAAAQLTPTRWAVEGMTAVFMAKNDPEHYCRGKYPSAPAPALSRCVLMQDFMARDYGNHHASMSLIFGMLFLLILLPLAGVWQKLKGV